MALHPWTTQTNGIATPVGVYSDSELLRIPYVASEMPLLNDGSSLFWKLMNTIPMGEAVDQPRFEYFVDEKFETQVAVADAGGTGVILVGATTFTSSDTIVIANQALYNQRTGEIVYVTGVSGSTVTMERGWGGTTAAAMDTDDVLIILLTNLPEGANANDGVIKLPTKDYNYVGFFSETVSATDVQEMTNMRDGVGKMASTYTDVMKKIIEQMDNQLRFGVRAVDNRAEGTVYSGGGFVKTVLSAINIPNSFSWDNLNDLWNDLFLHTASSPTKILMCGQTAYNKILSMSRIDQNAVQPPKFMSEIGAMVTRITLSGGGVLDVVLDKYGFHTKRNLQADYYIIDPAHIKRRPYKGFEDITTRDVTQPGSHTLKDEMYGSIGLQITFPDDVHARGAFLSA